MAFAAMTSYVNAYPSNTAPNAKGQLTGTRAYQLNAPAKYTVTALYYDYRGCVVQTHASNHLGGFEDTYFAYTFTGKVKQRQQMHSAPNATTQTENYTYDYGTPATNPAERLQSVHYKLNGNAQVTLAQYTYDDVGRVKTKTLGTETSTYAYNIRSWVTQITGAKFNQTLTYNAAVNGVTPTKALYGGNISAMKWKSGDESAERGYRFTYDRLDRLTAAAYGEGAALTGNQNRFNESVTYNDKMGNIHTLQRQGKITTSTYGLMDNLTYAYFGNKLTKVTDAVTAPVTNPEAFHFLDGANVADEFTYDTNGNITKDLNKNITAITYNSLNLPSVITFGNGNTATYVYDGAGNKLSVAYKSGTVMTKMDYAGNKVYSNGTLSMILTEEGYLTLSGTTPTYYYYLKDHQGNNCVVLNQSGAVQQVNHFYAFGGLFGEGAQTVKQRYRYNGKELDTELGLNMYDYGARHYDAALGRWFTVDPLAEASYHNSPFVYTSNNPVNKIDPTGMLDDWVEDEFKHLYWNKNATSQSMVKKGERYIGKTVYAANEDGDFKYGDQYGNWHESAPLGEVGVTGVHISSGSSFNSALRNVVLENDHEWINGFMQFVDVGLTGINLTLSATMLAANAGSLSGGARTRAALNTSANRIANSRALGIAGEQSVGISGSKTAINVGGRNRIPDALTRTTLTEVKNVKSLSFTRQLRDFHTYSQQNGLDFILYSRPNTTLSGPLQQAINNGSIIHRFIP